MSLSTLLNQPCTIQRRSLSATETDRYGTPQTDRTEVETLCDLQQRTRLEPGDQGELSVTEWRLYLPVDTPIDTSDVVTVDDVQFEVVGDPANKRQGTAQVHHVECTLKRSA